MVAIERSRRKIVLSNKSLQHAFSAIMFIILFIGFTLHVVILSKHRGEHYARIIKEQQTIQTQQSHENHRAVHYEGEEDKGSEEEILDPSLLNDHPEDPDEDPHMHEGKAGDVLDDDYELPLGFQHVLARSKRMEHHCSSLPPLDFEEKVSNDEILNSTTISTMADLPPFGIISALKSYQPKTASEVSDWDCQLPPRTECGETQMTAVFLGYRPDRLQKFSNQVRKMLDPEIWAGLIKEVILVWNGNLSLKDTDKGRTILRWAKDPEKPFRIVYPLQEGFSNDLMNRYHPRWGVSTKAILFYDDDGPFYSIPAVTSAFEYWKRNANSQIGAMARLLDLGPRAQAEKKELRQSSNVVSNDDLWVSNCRVHGDNVKYHFQHFAQTQANMALPSGSILHRNFLCFLWHPALEPIRQFVRAHPVHPDDVTVSTIVSHVSGRPPQVYSRRLNPPDTTPANNATNNKDSNEEEEEEGKEEETMEELDQQRRRRLLWDDGNTRIWAAKREAAVNSLVGYFGSLNGGSDGWCFGTPYHDKEIDFCFPAQARYGMLPWMAEDNTPLPCPQIREITEKQYIA